MKKTLAVTFLSAFAALSAMAQGTINFNNIAGATINMPIRVVGGAAAQPVDNVRVDLFYGATAGTVTTSRSLQVQLSGNGYFTAASTGNLNPVTIPGFDTGTIIFCKIVAWQGGTSYGDVLNTTRVESAVAQVGLGGGTTPTPNIPLGAGFLQLQSVIVPEPATIALAGLGFASLLFLRRRK